MTKSTFIWWIRPIYLYAVSIISLVVFLIGTITVLNLLIREYAFGVSGNWYEDPAMSCEYILTDNPPNMRVRVPLPDRTGSLVLDEMTEAERNEAYQTCVTQAEHRLEQQNRYNFADSMSRGISMIVVSIPLFLFHWSLIRREKHN